MQVDVLRTLHCVEAHEITLAHPTYVGERRRGLLHQSPEKISRNPTAFDEREPDLIFVQKLQRRGTYPVAAAKLYAETHVAW